mgnify:CR=1 FL=1
MTKPIILTTVAGLCMATIAAAETPVLTVMTYDSFTSDWGPGPAVEAAFEETCACDLQFLGAGDGAALLARLQFDGLATVADIASGHDPNLTAALPESIQLAPHHVMPHLPIPLAPAAPAF